LGDIIMMRASVSLALAVAAALGVAASPSVLAAQSQQKSAPPQSAPPQQQTAPPKPYQPLAVTLPAPVTDPNFEELRKEIARIAQRKDRAALAKMVVAKGFFWEREDGKPAPKRPGIDILARALNLAAKDGSGWDALAGFAAEPTAAPLPERKDILCAPATPTFDERGLEELAQKTDTDPLEWGYPLRDNVEVRETPNATAPVIEKLGMHFVRVLDDDAQSTANTAGEWLRVVAPSGKIGFVPADSLTSPAGAQLCYTKEGDAWRIAGLIGGGE
jgi:hypothetical protein